MDRNARMTVMSRAAMCLMCGWFAASADCQEPATVAPAADVAQARQEYQQWCERNAKMSLKGLKLIITAFQGEEKAQDRDENTFGTGIVSFGCKVALNGALSHFSISDFGQKGGSGSSIAVDDLKRLDELLAKLPDDGGRLPAAGRRVLIQTTVTDRTIVRVYDLANAAPEILEILRLSRSGIRVWLPEFEPESVIEARPHQHGGFLCLSPDRTQILFTSTNGPLQRWEPTTHETLGEIRLHSSPEAIAYNSDATKAVFAGWGECEVVDTKKWQRVQFFAEPMVDNKQQGLSAPRFTSDGKYLVLQCSEPALRIFETATWKAVPHLPNVPEDTLRYLPAPQRKLAVVQTKRGSIALWDLARNAAVAELDQGCSVSEAVFAPDESQFVTVTNLKWNEVRLRLWETDTGKFVREFLPFEQNRHEKLRRVFWSPDGQYLLAATKCHSFFTSEGISVWNVKTGRHRGEFSGCPTDVNGIVLLPDGSQLVAGCVDGKIRFWDFPAAMERIRSFENSLRVQ